MEIAANFRTLKTDLDLTPIFHKKDNNTIAHLHLGLLAYWVLHTIRYQQKKEGIYGGWREIIHILNIRKAVTTLARSIQEEVIII